MEEDISMRKLGETKTEFAVVDRNRCETGTVNKYAQKRGHPNGGELNMLGFRTGKLKTNRQEGF